MIVVVVVEVLIITLTAIERWYKLLGMKEGAIHSMRKCASLKQAPVRSGGADSSAGPPALKQRIFKLESSQYCKSYVQNDLLLLLLVLPPLLL